MSSVNYYKITISYEIPYNVLDSQDQDIQASKNILYERLKSIVPDRYERFYSKLTLHQLTDTFNFIVTYESFFRSTSGLPMEEYVAARDIKDQAKKELEDFFSSVDCEFKQLNIKSLL